MTLIVIFLSSFALKPLYFGWRQACDTIANNPNIDISGSGLRHACIRLPFKKINFQDMTTKYHDPRLAGIKMVYGRE